MPAPPPRFFAPLFALLVFCFPGSAPSEAADFFSWIAKAAAAKHRVTFVGRQEILMLEPSDESDEDESQEEGAPVHWVHIVADVTQSGPIARMGYVAPASAQGRMVVDDGRWVRQWETRRRLVIVEQSREESPLAQRRMLRLLRRNYTANALGAQRVSGLWCEQVAVRPRPGHVGPMRVLWIERRRFAVLRAAEYDVSGRLRYASVYEQFHYVVSVPQSAFAPPAGMASRRVGPTEQEEPNFYTAFHAAGLPERLPCWLPAGYALASCAVMRSGADAAAVVLRYGDGLNSITVLEAPGRLCVLPDAALPPSLGASLLAALAPQTEGRLQRALAQEFGPDAMLQARRLRRQGWGYDAIAAWCLRERAGHRAPFQSAQPSTRDEHAALRWILRVMHNPSFFRSAEGVSF